MFGLAGDEALTANIAIVFVTVLVAGLMSGLTLALFSLEENYLKVMVTSGTHSEMRHAQRLLPLLQEPHWLLVTLLLCNAAAVESLPLALNQLVSPAMAIILSVTMVLLFGEIIPQAAFVRHALVIGGFAAAPLKMLMLLTGIISYPLGKLLDRLVGHKIGILYRRFELREFIRLQVAEAAGHGSSSSSSSSSSPSEGGGGSANDSDSSSDSDAEQLTRPEISIMLGALSLSEGTANSIMRTTIDQVFSVSIDATVDKALVTRIFEKGYSRILVHESGNPEKVTHYLIAKTLILLIFKDEADAPKVRDLVLRKPLYCTNSTPLHELYALFQRGESHMAVIRDADHDGGTALGITTVEDLMEMLHQTNFLDETDMDSKRPAQVLMSQWKKDRVAARQHKLRQQQHSHFVARDRVAANGPSGSPRPTTRSTALESPLRQTLLASSFGRSRDETGNHPTTTTGRPKSRQTADSPLWREGIPCRHSPKESSAGGGRSVYGSL